MAFFKYPLNLRFKLIALSPQIIVTDSSGQQVAYVHQKVWKVREDIRIFSDESRAREVFRIHTDKIFDFNSKYYFTDSTTGQPLGYVQPAALRSIWRATYRIHDPAGAVQHHIKEDNPWVKVLDALVSEIPFVNMFTGYFLNPAYTAFAGDTENEGTPQMRLTKQPAFFESSYTIEQMGEMSIEEEKRLLLGVMLMVQFMRRRG